MPINFDDDDDTYPEEDVFQIYLENRLSDQSSQSAPASSRSSSILSSIDAMANNLRLESPQRPTRPSVSGVGVKRPIVHPESSSLTPTKIRRTGSEETYADPFSGSQILDADTLDPYIIAHDQRVQSLLDRKRVPWGTIFELARGVTNGSWLWSDITGEYVDQLCGTNAETAPRVSKIITGKWANMAVEALEVWAEYDREQAAIMEHKGRGLGGMGLWYGKDNWHGGKIQQVGRLKEATGNESFFIQLEQPEVRRSHRFGRYLGSRRILQVKVPETLSRQRGDEVRRFFECHKFILCGRVFLPFHAKEGGVYMVETNNGFGRRCNPYEGDHYRLSFMDFINWHNPFKLNSHQPISKWSARWALGLSTSVPTISFDDMHIQYIEDEYVTPADWGSGKAPAEKTYTDGCGWINGAALTQIMRRMGYSSRPTAVQGRIGGAKGMWVLHPDPAEQVADGGCKIWIRSSQNKISLPKPVPKSQRIFELLAPSRVTGPCRLSAQTLINLTHNGVPNEIIKKLMAHGIQEEVKELVDWNGPQSMLRVWRAVEKAGGVVISHIQRRAAGEVRALGIGKLREFGKQEQGDEDEGDIGVEETGIGNVEVDEVEVKVEEKAYDLGKIPLQKFSGRCPFSGRPLGLHQTALELLQAGFHPLKLKLLFDKLEKVLTMLLDSYVQKFHIPVTESVEAYVVPDPYGVLNEDEIHFRSSEPFIDPITGAQQDIIVGPVLVSRNPTRLPSDIQKVTAISHPKLANYFNVIMFPTKGKFTLASYLGGGDYDGDTVMLTWCRELVDNFKNFSRCEEPKGIREAFEREVEHVRDFDRRISNLSLKEAQQALQKVLILGLAETRVGLYSIYHDLAVYKKGYDSQEAIKLAYMFTTCLDSNKTGLRVKENVFLRDQKTWGSEQPFYVQVLGEKKKKSYMVRRKTPFILDALVEYGQALKQKHLKDYQQHWNSQQDEDADEDLAGHWKAARAKADQARAENLSIFSSNMEDIEMHVQGVWEDYLRVTAAKKEISKSGSSSDAYTELACRFSQKPSFRLFQAFSDGDVHLIKASFAAKRSLSFACSVAFKDLCSIKAQASGSVAFTHLFAESMSIPKKVVQTLSR
ncbi:RNA dependent RNA polymerase-domain-containing protein [Pisolithus sp. B1]|nr:RNA dependent RNA polymerase-domain-containing protein [Pisolithus sp. B1]